MKRSNREYTRSKTTSALPAWSNTERVNRELDEQHRRIILLINRFYTGIACRKQIEVVVAILDEWLDFTQVHFAFEDYYFHGPVCRGHKHHHLRCQAIAARIMDFQTKIRPGDYEMGMELLQYLRNWLVEHMGTRQQLLAFHAI